MSGYPGPAVFSQLSEWTVVGVKQDFDRDNRLRYMRSQGKWKVAIITTPVKEAIDKKGSSGNDIDKDKYGKRIELGMFATKAEAELVHDLRILKLEGVTCNGELNLDITLFCPKLARLVSIKDTTDVTSANTQESMKIEIKQQLNFLNIDEATKKEVEERMNKSQRIMNAHIVANNHAMTNPVEIAGSIPVVVDDSRSTSVAIAPDEADTTPEDAVAPPPVTDVTTTAPPPVTDVTATAPPPVTDATHVTDTDSNTSSDVVIENADEEALQWCSTPSVIIDLEQDVSSQTSTQKILQTYDLNLGSGVRKIDSDVIPVFNDAYNQNWDDRITSSYVHPVSYTYEITFEHSNSLGLNLKPCFVPYAAGLAKRSLGCLLVMNTNSTLGTIVRPGDILLKVNGQELASAFGVFSFDTHTKMILKETAPRTVRFIRPGSVPLSPLEILEMAKDIQQPTAKFSFVSETPTSKAYLFSTYLDQAAPLSVKKCMTGTRVQWEFPGDQPSTSHYNPNVLFSGDTSTRTNLKKPFPPFCELGTSSSSLALIFTKRALLQSISSGGEIRVYRDRGKYATVIKYHGKLYYLGKYDTEDDAMAVLRKYSLDIEKTGIFVPRKVRKYAGNMLTASEVYGLTEEEYIQKMKKKAGDDSLFYNVNEDGDDVGTVSSFESLKKEFQETRTDSSVVLSNVDPSLIFSSVKI